MTDPKLADEQHDLAHDEATLDVFLAAYADHADGEVIASVVDPLDDLLTLGALRRILAALTQPVAGRDAPKRLSEAPCDQCGYNGPSYYQPDTHPCAAAHHAHNNPTKTPPMSVWQIALITWAGTGEKVGT